MLNKSENLWLNFLHLYQPANKDAYYIQEATERSYTRLIRALEEHQNIKFTLNISGCLFLRWDELGYIDLINRVKKLLDKGQIEITGTAAYHALLPLVSADEIVNQIKENEIILKKYFGKKFKPKGFFLPEMAYSPAVGKIIKKLGYDWVILDEISAVDKIPVEQVGFDKLSGLKIIFRSRRFSNTYVPDKILDFFQENNLVVTATDAELYGLRHEDPTAELEKILKNKTFNTLTISEYFKSVKKLAELKLRASSWETTMNEIKKQTPFIVWQNKKNKIQVNLWEMADLTQKLIKKYKNNENHVWARWHLVRGLASCAFWWASGRDFSHNFGPQAWNPDEIERGINELIRSVRSLHSATTIKEKMTAEKLYLKIKKLVWEKHWGYYWKL